MVDELSLLAGWASQVWILRTGVVRWRKTDVSERKEARSNLAFFIGRGTAVLLSSDACGFVATIGVWQIRLIGVWAYLAL